MKRTSRIAIERRQHVKPESATAVHNCELTRRLHLRDACGHVAHGAIGHGQKQDAGAGESESRPCRHQSRMQRAREAAA